MDCMFNTRCKGKKMLKIHSNCCVFRYELAIEESCYIVQGCSHGSAFAGFQGGV